MRDGGTEVSINLIASFMCLRTEILKSKTPTAKIYGPNLPVTLLPYL